MKQHIF